MITTIRTYKAAAFLLALAFGVLLVQGVGATDSVRFSPQSAEELATREGKYCKSIGGTPSYHYDMNEDGSVFSITVNCEGGDFDFACDFVEGPPTAVVCTITPGSTEPSRHTPIGGGALEEVEASTSPVNGELGGGTLDTPDAETARSTFVGRTSATIAQAEDDDDEQP